MPPRHRVPGAYGLRIHGMTETLALQPVPATLPPLTIKVEMDQPIHDGGRFGPDGTGFNLAGGGHVAITRSPITVRFAIPEHGTPPDAASLVHPYLVVPAATAQYWLGGQAFHAGAFVVDGGAWIVAGDKGAGKSTTLAWLALRGLDVLADDLVVVADGRVHVGPRCLDLRREAATTLGVGTCIGVVGVRERWRYELPPVEPVARLAGWIYPAWAPQVRIDSVPPADRLGRLTHNLALQVPPRSPTDLLNTAALPTWRWTRPRDWAAIDHSIEALLDHLTTRAGTGSRRSA